MSDTDKRTDIEVMEAEASEVVDAAALQDDRDTMVKVDHVTMRFNMASESLGSLKEYAIAIARGKLRFQELLALDDVSFEVKRGDVFGIMGTNGSGKSTMLKIIAGVLDPSSGSCTVNGHIAPLIELGAGFDMELTARENIYLNGALLGYTKQFIDENFDAIVTFAEVWNFLDMPMKNYSSGMVARVAFAIATVIVPDILVVDEVLAVGDFMFQKKCEDRISQLIEEYGVTVLIVSHNNEQIARLCNRAIWIEKGQTKMLDDASVVCETYAMLGGRYGSKEAEKRVRRVAELASTDADFDPSEFSKHVYGNNPIETNLLMANKCKFKSTDTVVLVCEDTHINGVVGSPLAAALNAPMLATAPSRLDELVKQKIIEMAPSKVVLVDYGDGSSYIVSALEKLEKVPEILYFHDNSKGPFWFSLDIYNYGREHGLWGSDMSFVAFEDVAESIAATALFYNEKCPALVSREDSFSYEELIATVQSGSPNKLYVLGETAAKLLPPDKQSEVGENVKVRYVADEDSARNCMDICKLVDHLIEKKGSAPSKLMISTFSEGQWHEQLVCSEYAAKLNAPILLIDQKDLDGMVSGLDYLEENPGRFKKLVFVGGSNCVSQADVKIFSYELKRHLSKKSK